MELARSKFEADMKKVVLFDLTRVSLVIYSDEKLFTTKVIGLRSSGQWPPNYHPTVRFWSESARIRVARMELSRSRSGRL